MNESPDLDELAATLKSQYAAAEQYYEQLLPYDRQAFQYYEGQLFGNEVEGRSQIVLPDVQETIDYMAQSVLRTFVSGDRTVEFEATDESDEQQVDDATAGVNYIFMRQQDGFRILHDTLFDGLLKKRGIFKTVCETVEKVSRESIVAPLDALAVQLPEGVEIEDVADNGDGTVTAQVKHERTEKRFVDYSVPTNEFKFSANAWHEDESDYLCHACPKTRSDLIEMGFDRDQVYELAAHRAVETTESNRLDNFRHNAATPELEEVLLCEEYARIDLDDDGIAERVRVFRVDNEVLRYADGKPAVETVDEQPFSVFCPFPRPHRLIGYSLADKVLDLQLARSFVARQLFDGMALANMPRPVVDTRFATADTYADILSPIPGSPIRAPGGSATVAPFQTGFDVGKSLQVMEWITGERESRTGITRLNQGLDADALNKTATGTALMQAQGQQGEEMIARQFAEAVARLFAKKYRLMRGEAEPFKVKVDGRYREVDPSQWPEEINVVIRVGLGSNSKDKRIGYRMALAEALQMSVQAGTSGAEHVFKWFDGMARDTGIGQGDDFAYDPEPEIDPATGQPKQPQEKPDPEVEAKKAEIAAKQQENEAKIALERDKAGAQIDIMREKHQLDMQQRREQAAQEAELAREQMMIEAGLEQDAMHLKAATDVHISKNRPGGALDA